MQIIIKLHCRKVLNLIFNFSGGNFYFRQKWFHPYPNFGLLYNIQAFKWSKNESKVYVAEKPFMETYNVAQSR